MGLTLGHELLVYSTFHRVLYVANVSQSGIRSDPVRVGLPSSNVLAMAVDETLAAVLLRIDDKTSSVVLYDWNTSRTTSFKLEHQAYTDQQSSRILAQALLLNAKDNRLEVFGATPAPVEENGNLSVHYDRNGNPSMPKIFVGHMRFSLTGKKLCESDSHWWGDVHDNLSRTADPTNSPEIHIGAINHSGRSGFFCFSLSTHPTNGTYDQKKSIVFDAVQGEFYQLEALMDMSYLGSPTILWKKCTYTHNPAGYIESARLYSKMFGYKVHGGRTSSFRPPRRYRPRPRRR